MKEKYEKIEIEIEEIDADDVITTSSPSEDSQRENSYFDFDDLFGETYFS